MKKIPTLLERDPADRSRTLPKITEGCEWVFAGEGKATRKFDGTCTMLDGDGKWWARREIKPGKTAPPNYIVDNTDPITGKTQGWEPIEQSPFAKFFNEVNPWPTKPGTFELIGPKINGNPEHVDQHELVRHGSTVFEVDPPATPEEAIELVRRVGDFGMEGIVWHHPDGRMAKLKVKDLR